MVTLVLLCGVVWFVARPDFSIPLTSEASLTEEQGTGGATVSQPDLRIVSPDSPASAAGELAQRAPLP